MVAFPIGAEEAESQSKVQCEPTRDVEVILKVRLQDFVTVVVLHEAVLLSEALDVAQQEIGKWVSACGGGERRIEGQIARNRTSRQLAAKFVLLCRHEVGAK